MATTPTPIYPQTPNPLYAALTSSVTANTKSDGTGTIGTDLILMAPTALDANGRLVRGLIVNPWATAAATAMAATVIRAFRCTKVNANPPTGATTPGTDTWLLGEVAIPAQNADNSTSIAPAFFLAFNRAVTAGDRILVSTHVVCNANTGFHLILDSADY